MRLILVQMLWSYEVLLQGSLWGCLVHFLWRAGQAGDSIVWSQMKTRCGTYVLILALSLSCWPRFPVSEARSLPAKSTKVSLACRVSFSKPNFSLLVTMALSTAWLRDEVAFASVLSVFLRKFPSCTKWFWCRHIDDPLTAILDRICLTNPFDLNCTSTILCAMELQTNVSFLYCSCLDRSLS